MFCNHHQNFEAYSQVHKYVVSSAYPWQYNILLLLSDSVDYSNKTKGSHLITHIIATFDSCNLVFLVQDSWWHLQRTTLKGERNLFDVWLTRLTILFLICYVLELNKFVGAVEYVFCLVLYPENELHAHELVNSAFAYSSQPFTIPKAASFLSLWGSEVHNKCSGYEWHHLNIAGCFLWRRTQNVTKPSSSWNLFLIMRGYYVSKKDSFNAFCF